MVKTLEMSLSPITPNFLRNLRELRKKASSGPWKITHPSVVLGDDHPITISTDLRQTNLGSKGPEGPILSVNTSRYYFPEKKYKGDTVTTEKVKLKNANDDAAFLIAAVNAVDVMAELLLEKSAPVEPFYVIMFNADRYGPIRYWSAGESPVIDVDHATHFVRQDDAKRILNWQQLATAGYVQAITPINQDDTHG